MVRPGPGGAGVAVSAVATAYNSSGAAWQRGPARIYDRLADMLADSCPVPLAGVYVLDLGAGTGAAARAAERRGAHVVSVDIAMGMLNADAPTRPPAVVGDALALPFASGSFDAVIAAFSLNHLTAPAIGLREATRVLRAGGGLVVGASATDDGHPVREVTDSAAAARGWVPPPWYVALQADALPLLATVERAEAAARAAGLADVVVTKKRVSFPELAVADLVAWRMGMAQLAPFVSTLAPAASDALAADAAARLGDAPPLVRSVIVISHRAAA